MQKSTSKTTQQGFSKRRLIFWWKEEWTTMNYLLLKEAQKQTLQKPWKFAYQARLDPSMWHKPMRSLHLNRHELNHAAALFRIAVLGFCIVLPSKEERKKVDSSKWKMLSHHQQIQASVAGLMIQCFAWYRLNVSNCSLVPHCSPNVSHHLSAILEMKTTIFANCSRVIPRSAESLLRVIQSHWTRTDWESKSATRYATHEKLGSCGFRSLKCNRFP